MLVMNWRGSGVDQTLYESSFFGPTNDPPFASATPLSDRASLTGPALATFQGMRFMAWRGVDGDGNLYYATDHGSGWTPQIQLGDRASANGPALATYQGELLMAWRGVGDDQRLWWATYPDLTRDPPWSEQHSLDDRASLRGPSLAVFQSHLFMAWRGVLGDQHLYWSTFDGNNWSPQHPLFDRASVDCPAIVSFGTRLFMFWRGGSSIDESDLRLYMSEYLGGDPEQAWSPQAVIINTVGHTLGSDSRPGIAAFNGQLFIASVGAVLEVPIGNPDGAPEPPNDPRIFVETFDGSATVGHVITPQQTDYQPGLCRFQNDQYAALWQLTDGPAWQARHRLTADEYQQAFDDLGSQGYQLAPVNGYELDGEDRYAAIWQLTDGPAWQARHRLTAGQYQQTFDDLGSQGYRLVQVSGY